MNLYQQSYREVASNRTIYQHNFILSPVFIFCSYLPYELNIEICASSSLESHPIHANSLYYGGQNIGSNKSLAVHLKHSPDATKEEEQTSGALSSQNWFEKQVMLLDQGSLNVSECLNRTNNTLKLANLYEYKYIENGVQVLPDKESDFGIRIDSAKLAAIKPQELLEKGVESKKMEPVKVESSNVTVQSRKFLIEKSICWNFSRTIRVDIKPVCLMVNKTGYVLRLTEREFDPVENKEMAQGTPIEYLVKENNGKICLSDFTSQAKSVKKYKFTITLDEYSMLDNLKDNKRLTSTISMEDFDFNVHKNTVDYESDWIEISDEPVSPFYRENQQEQAKCLFADKCWIDLKLFPAAASPTANQQTYKPKLKFIYLLLQSDEYTYSNRSNDTANLEDISPTRLLTVQTKFLINNKTTNNLKCELISQNTGSSQKREFIGLSDCEFIQPRGFYPTGEVVNTLAEKAASELAQVEDNDDSTSLMDAELNRQYALLDEKINDLFYFRIKEISNHGKETYFNFNKKKRFLFLNLLNT